MIGKLIIVTMISIDIVLAQCPAKCGSLNNVNPVCGSNGNVYDSAFALCCSDIKVPVNFVCKDFGYQNSSDCKEPCKKEFERIQCVSNCTKLSKNEVPTLDKTMCSTSGVLIGNLCMAKCNDPNITAVGTCEDLAIANRQDCANKCSVYARCNRLRENPSLPVCGSDANYYRDQAAVDCVNKSYPRIVNADCSDCQNKENKITNSPCKDFVMLTRGEVAGTSRRPARK